jgi:hypothetical protein
VIFYFTVRRQDVLSMLKTVFSTLTVAMRYEPANAKFFETDVSLFDLKKSKKLIYKDRSKLFVRFIQNSYAGYARVCTT